MYSSRAVISSGPVLYVEWSSFSLTVRSVSIGRSVGVD